MSSRCEELVAPRKVLILISTCTMRSLSLLVLSLLATSASLDVSATEEATPTQPKDYEILSTIHESDSAVAVVRRNAVLFLLYDQTIIGAEFDDPYLRKQAAYPGFAIMQCVKYLDRAVEKAIQVGLGIGTVPSFLRHHGIPTDVVEISRAVVRQAANYFQYEHCEDDDPEDCEWGTTYVADGLAFIDKAPAEPLYDSFIIDVYTGWNPVVFFTKEVIDTVHAKWLKPRGVVVLNFVGFINGEHADVPKSIYRTLQTSFQYVKCYRELPNVDEESSINIVYFASDEEFTFNVPDDGEYADPPELTYFHVIKNFQQWQIFSELDDEPSVQVEIGQAVDGEEVTFSASTSTPVSSRVQVLTKEDDGADVFRPTHEFTQEHMRQRVAEQFPEVMWQELAIAVK